MHVGGLISLHTRFLFHHHDLCLFHQSIYRGIGERHDALEEFVAKHRGELDATYSIDEWEAVGQARLRETIHTWNSETAGIAGFADQLLLVGLWSMVEQYCGQVLLISEQALGHHSPGTDAPHQWNGLELRLSRLGLSVTDCKSYGSINECRIMNNKVKHVGKVDAQLAALCPFAGPIGRGLETVAFPLQRYSDGVFEFVGHVMEAVDDLVAKQTSRA